MKSKEQILAWVNSHSWRNSFYKQAFLAQNKISYAINFISNSFDWSSSEEGFDYWSRIDDDYCTWYVSCDKPKTWNDFCKKTPINPNEVFISNYGEVKFSTVGTRDILLNKNIIPSKHYACAFLAYMQLIQLRNAWLKDEDYSDTSWKITFNKNNFEVVEYEKHAYGLSFPTKEMAKEFLKTFADLIETAKWLF